MADRDLTRTGVQVDFFGEPTRMPAGSGQAGHRDRCARCCRCTAGTTATAGASTSTRRWTRSSGDVAVITQALADRFAANIAAHPADWHMLQPQWLADLSDERPRAGWRST